MISKEQWVNLAEALVKQHDYEREYNKMIFEVANKYGQETDFLGNSFGTDVLYGAVEKILGDEFLYWMYDCEKSFEEYNDGITYPDGAHPNVHNLEDLYDETMKKGR